jgi:uncharacterized membrane protein YeaQ/YmgE (transglycosylase-associated protein family)
MIGTIILGLIAGWITGLLMRGSGFGIVADIIVGLIGAVIGRWLFGALGVVQVGTIGYLLMSVIGAVILVTIVHAISRG